MRVLALALGALLVPASAWAYPFPVIDAAGVVWDSTDPGLEGVTRNFLPHYKPFQPNISGTGVAHFYLLFYNNDGVVWTSADMRYFEGLFAANAFGSAAILGLDDEYPVTNDQAPYLNYTSGVFAQSTLDNNNEGNGCVATAALLNNIGSTLPHDGSGVYIFLPAKGGSGSSMSTCAAQNFTNGNNEIEVEAYPLTGFPMSRPNLEYIATGETRAGIINVSRWACTGQFASSSIEACISNGNVREEFICPSGPQNVVWNPFFDGGSPNGLLDQLANLTWIDDAGVLQYGNVACAWQRKQQVGWPNPLGKPWCGSQGEKCHCVTGTYPNFWTIGCRQNSDCPPPSLRCDPATGHCAPPTCIDGVQNNNELAPDIGGWCDSPLGGPCRTSAECILSDAGVPGTFSNCIGDGAAETGICQ